MRIDIPSAFRRRIIDVIRRIPAGKVATYGQIAAVAGKPYGTREVVRVPHSSSEKENLPWHRVVNRFGRVFLSRHRGYELQRARLESEGVVFDESQTMDPGRFRCNACGNKRGRWMNEREIRD